MKYKLLALDLDGTLTNDRKEVTQRTYDALMDAQRSGIRIVLASGRPTYGVMPLAKTLRLHEFGGYVMAFNGGRIVDCQTGEVVTETKLDDELVPVIYRYAVEAGLALLTYRGETIVTNKADDRYVRHNALDINKMPLVGLADFLAEIEYPVNKCLIVGEPDKLCLLEEKMQREVGERMGVCRSMPFFLELVPHGVDKAKSLATLLERVGMDRSELVAFGDGWNDLSMIEFAGLGVAMENAAEDVKAKADYVTLSNNEDGVAYVIEKILRRNFL